MEIAFESKVSEFYFTVTQTILLFYKLALTAYRTVIYSIFPTLNERTDIIQNVI